MKANEFVKKFGWGKAIELIEFYNRCGSFTCDCDFTYDDLKRLVESHELVNSYGGLIGAKKKLKELKRLLKYRPMDYSAMNRFCVIEKAIADVESCQ